MAAPRPANQHCLFDGIRDFAGETELARRHDRHCRSVSRGVPIESTAAIVAAATIDLRMHFPPYNQGQIEWVRPDTHLL
jgi:hypothetical protein